MSTSRTPGVWDLTDETVYPAVPLVPVHRDVRPDLGGPLAATFGVVALAVALVPALPPVARWCLVVPLVVSAALIGFAALRRRQTLLTALLAAGGLAAPVLAVAALLLAPQPPAAVENAVLPEGSPFSTSATVQSSPDLDARPIEERIAATDAAVALALHLRAMHGVFGPYPVELADVGRQVVEASGAIQGVQVGTLPDSMRLDYAVSPDRRFFEVRVEVTDHPEAVAVADSTIDLPAVP